MCGVEKADGVDDFSRVDFPVFPLHRSRTTSHGDQGIMVAEYAPTQVLAEVFRNAGFDGVVYGSKLGKGKTIAIFDLTAAELVNCHLYRVEGVNLTFSETANPYFVQKYYDGQVEAQAAVPAGESGNLSEE
jgi:RES domain